MTLDRIVRLPELIEVIGLSAATLYRWMDEGQFPRPVKLGPNSVGWRSSVIQAWLNSREEVEARTTSDNAKVGARPEAKVSRFPSSTGRRTNGRDVVMSGEGS